MKKTLSLILALLMVLSCASAIFADDAAVADTAAETATYQKAIDFLSKYGIYKGGDAAENDIKRYQMALFVARVSTGWVEDSQWEDGPENWTEFNDIGDEPANKYLGALSYANEKGIIEGYGDGRFGPYDGITYQNALTMVVRTLGYQGLSWPWGYIQKGVELGLTREITGVAYTDILTRAEVAQIIYNAMFAETKDGTTLAAKSFGLNLEWRNVIVTATDIAKIFADGSTTYNATTPNQGYEERVVEIMPINSDGTFTDEKYYINPTMLGFSEFGHDDENALGHAYKVLFNANDNGNYVDIIDYEPLYTKTIWALGDTDDEGKALDAKVVRNYVDKTNNDGDELSLSELNLTRWRYTDTANFYETRFYTAFANGKASILLQNQDIGRYLYMYEIATGDILVWNDDDEIYETLWYYDSLLDTYFRYVVVNVSGPVLRYHYMTDAEKEQLKEVFNDRQDVLAKGTAGLALGIQKSNIFSNKQKSAYASIDLFDVDGNTYGIFSEYGLGYFENGTAECYETAQSEACGNAQDKSQSTDRATYRLYTIKPYGDGLNLVYENFAENACAHHNDPRDTTGLAAASLKNGNSPYAWINPLYTPVEGEKKGTYLDGYCIFGFDMFTGEIRVIKNVKNIADKTEADDVDTYIATGTLRAYNLAQEKVQIDDTVFSIGLSASLGGAPLVDLKYYNTFNDNTYSKDNLNQNANAKFNTNENNAYFKSLYNQFVQYIVIDGKIVDITPVGKVDNNVLVVNNFAGQSADGYIVINAYNTADLKLQQYRIASYDGWRSGDVRYYPSFEKMFEYFTKGMVLQISSYSEAEDAYNVETVGSFGFENGDRTFYRVTDVEATPFELNFDYAGEEENEALCEDGRVMINGEPVKMTNDDKYIFVANNFGSPYPSINVYQGIITNPKWELYGDRIDGTDENVYVIVNAEGYGFDFTKFNTSLVVVTNNRYAPSMSFDGWGFGEESDKYLLGASMYSVLGFDLIAGKIVVLENQYNVDALEGHIYTTYDGNIIGEVGVDEEDAIYAIADVIYDYNKGTATYYSGVFKMPADGAVTPGLVEDAIINDYGTSNYNWNDLVKSVKALNLTKVLNGSSSLALGEVAEDTLILYIFNVSTGEAVVYAVEPDWIGY